jgi:cob(I)alamin adenosyltransferase
MSIYTRTGDDGTTSLFGGSRVSKSDIQIDAYGSLDELTSIMGLFVSHINNKEEGIFVKNIQQDLYAIMGMLAGAPADLKAQKNKAEAFELKIDSLTRKLPPLKDFIIPGGSLGSCWAHMARVSCRKSERIIIRYFLGKKIIQKKDSQLIIKYLNRLSDLLFTYARFFNTEGDAVSKKI